MEVLYLTTSKGKIPFLKLKSGLSVRTMYPIFGPWLTVAETCSIFDASVQELLSLKLMTTYYQMHLYGAEKLNITWDADIAAIVGDYGGFCYGEFVKFVSDTDMYGNRLGYVWYRNVGGAYRQAVRFTQEDETYITTYYPSGSIAAYLIIGVVDDNKETCFVRFYVTGDSFYFEGNGSKGAIATLGLGMTDDDYYTMFRGGEWSGPPEPPPKGDWDIMDRFSPRVNTSCIGVYPLDKSQVGDLFSDLWEQSFGEAFVTSFLGNPAQSILSLRWFYGLAGKLQEAPTECYVKLGNVALNGTIGQSTITTHPALSEFVVLDMGEVDVPEAYNSYLDYAPYTKTQIYIPYYGYADISANDVMGGTVGLKYNINIITGVCMAIVTAKTPRTGDVAQEILTVPCQMSIDIPIDVTQMKNFLANIATSIANTAVRAGVAYAGGVAQASVLAGDISRKLDEIPMSSDPAGLTEDIIGLNRQATQARIEAGGRAGGMVLGDLPNGQLIPPPDVTRSGGMDCESGSLGSLRPYIIVTRPERITPDNIGSYYGQRSCQSVQLGTLSGFVQVAAVLPDSVGACKYTGEILSLLQAGVYL